MQKSTIASLKRSGPNLLKGIAPKVPTVAESKLLLILDFLKTNPGSYTAAQLGAVVGWGDRQTRHALWAIGLEGRRGKGYEWSQQANQKPSQIKNHERKPVRNSRGSGNPERDRAADV